MLALKISACYTLAMRTLQAAVKAILFLLLVLALNVHPSVFATDVIDNLESGEIADEPINLEEDSAVLPSSPDLETAPKKMAIRAISPGYNLPTGKNSGELIELVNLSNEELDLSSISIVYTSKPTSASPNGKETVLYTFPDGASFVGDTILLRFADSPETADSAQDLTYNTASLAMSGSLKLVLNNEILSSVCWLGGEGCLPTFSTTVKSRKYTTILLDMETGEYFHTNEYSPVYDPMRPGLYLPPENESLDETSDKTDDSSPEEPVAEDIPVCVGLEFSELLTYYADDKSEQFIEFYNSSSKSIPLDQCRLRYKNKAYPLATSPTAIAPDSYFVYYPTIVLTKNPNTASLYELLDVNDDIVDSIELPHGQKKSASFALTEQTTDGLNLWQITYAPTPGNSNIYQEFRTCPIGKVINVTTGNCINAATLDTVEKDCPAGKYRNPATGRCKSYDTDNSETTECKEGYERNPETGRCRKIKQNNGADYPLVPITDKTDNTSFVAIWALIGILALGLVYVLFQFRRDIYYSLRQIINKLKR